MAIMHICMYMGAWKVPESQFQLRWRWYLGYLGNSVASDLGDWRMQSWALIHMSSRVCTHVVVCIYFCAVHSWNSFVRERSSVLMLNMQWQGAGSHRSGICMTYIRTYTKKLSTCTCHRCCRSVCIVYSGRLRHGSTSSRTAAVSAREYHLHLICISLTHVHVISYHTFCIVPWAS